MPAPTSGGVHDTRLLLAADLALIAPESAARGLPSLRCGAKLLPVMDTLDIALRLCAATLVGIVLGLNRYLHGKPTGVRTLGILCRGSAVAVLSIHAVTGTDASRGAGVIVRSEKGHHVQGLTTAACVWVTACMGAACAVAQWQIVVIGIVLIFVVLVFGGPFEKAIDRRWPSRPT